MTGASRAELDSGPAEPVSGGETDGGDFGRIVASSTQAIAVAQDGRFVYVNAALRKIASHRGEALTARAFAEFVHPADRPALLERHARVLGGEGPLGPFEFRTIDDEGVVRWFRSDATRVEWRGRPAVATAIVDVTLARQAEQALRESEARYRQLVEHAPIGICEVDSESRQFLSVNDYMCDVLGYRREELLQLTWREVLAQQSTGQGDERRRRALLGLPIDEPVEYLVRARDGRELWVLVSARIVQRTDGRVIANVVAHDVTARHRMEEEQQKVAKLEALGVLAGGIAHDFNNILTAALANLALARQHLAEPAQLAPMVDDTERACLRARALAEQLLTFARGGEPMRKLVDLRVLVEDSARFALLGSKSRCEVCAEGTIWPVEADEGQLGQVIHNLVINADQAMPSGGLMKLSIANAALEGRAPETLPAGRYVLLCLEDRGRGIEPGDLSKVFDPYFTTKEQGSGLGLATTYSIVKRHGGHIEVESEPERGTTVRIYLPATEARPPLGSAARPAHHGRPARLLLMDDEPLVQRSTADLLRFLGHEVDSVSDGAEAVARYRSEKAEGRGYDLVILDLTVRGGMGGLETLAELRSSDSEVRALVASGYSEAPVMADCRQYGFRAAVRKPYTLTELEEALGRAMADDDP